MALGFRKRKQPGILDGLSGESFTGVAIAEDTDSAEQSERDCYVAEDTSRFEAMTAEELLHEGIEAAAEGDNHREGSAEAIEYYTRAVAFGQFATTKAILAQNTLQSGQ